MKRRDLLQISTALGLGASLSKAALAASPSDSVHQSPGARPADTRAASVDPLPAPADGMIPVAFLLSDGAVMIDFAGPWEVFESAEVNGHNPFHPYIVAETSAPVLASGGMTIVPRYSIANAPAPKLVVIPAQSDPTEPVLQWVRNVSKTADLVMSVCTGAFVLARTGLLDGKEATTHHSAYASFAMTFPRIRLKRGVRFVDLGHLATAGGLSSGIDLALHVVERYFGRDVATSAAYYMEYQGQGWSDPSSNRVYAQARRSTAEHPLCPVCEMDVDKASAPRSSYRGKTYYFCEQAHKDLFDSNPERYTSTWRASLGQAGLARSG